MDATSCSSRDLSPCDERVEGIDRFQSPARVTEPGLRNRIHKDPQRPWGSLSLKGIVWYNLNMPAFVHIHSSSRFNRSAASLRNAAQTYNNNADLVTYTEVEFENREAALRAAGGKGWGLVSGDHGNANDCAIAYNKERFELIHEEQFQSTGKRIYMRGGKPRALPYTTIAVLRDLHGGNILVVGVSHLASGVEGDLAKKRYYVTRTSQWRSAYRASVRRINRLARKHKANGRMFVADFNINLKRPFATALLKAMSPAYNHTWKKRNVKGGTHHKRIIDATLLRGKIKVRGTARLFRDDASSDHRPYIETLAWR